MMGRLLAGASLAVVLDLGAALAAAAGPGGSAAVMMPSMDPARYVAAANAYHMFEIHAGRMAQDMSKSSAMRTLGGKMVVDHSSAMSAMAAASRRSGLAWVQPKLTDHQQSRLGELRGVDPAAFDRMFLQQQTQMQSAALSMEQLYLERGSDMNIKRTAEQSVPGMQQSLKELQTMQASASN